MNHNLFELIRSRMPEDQTKAMITALGGEGYTYRDALAQTARLAHRLAALGVGTGDRVAVQVDKSPENLLLFLACLRAGAVYLPLNTAYTEEEVSYFLQDAEPALYVCTPAKEKDARQLGERCRCPRVAALGVGRDGDLLDGIEELPGQYETVMREAHDLAAILYTSGTTGRSKGAMLTHRNLASNAQALVDTWQFRPNDRLLHALPLFHTHGLFVACNTVLLVGAEMIFLPHFDLDEIIRWLPQCTVLMGVPTFYTRLLGSDAFTREVTANMRLFTSGSAPLTVETHREFRARTGHAILERYGMTETSMNTSNPYDHERRAGTVGFPLPGVELRLVSMEDGKIVPDGEIGVLEVRGPNVFKGYWRMPEKTAQEFRDDGFFITGDLGLRDEEGYIHISGRNKDLIISGGYNVYPKEVEQFIDELPEVLESAVIGLPHPDLGEGVTAVVVGRDGQTVDESKVLAALQNRLARYKQPKKVFQMDALPRNVMGKVQKKQLRDRFKNTYTL